MRDKQIAALPANQNRLYRRIHIIVAEVSGRQMLNLTDTIQANDSNTLTFQPMGFGEILDTIFSLYRKHFPLFLGIVALDIFGNLAMYLLARFLPNFALKGLLTDLVGMPFGLVSMGGIIIATATIYFGKHLRSRDALKQALYQFRQMLACYLPWSLVFGTPRLGMVYLVLFGLGTELWTESMSILLTVALLVSVPFSIDLPIDLWYSIPPLLTSVMINQMWLRFIPLVLTPFAIYFTVRWMFAAVVVLLERPLIRRAFARSNELGRGRWWQTWKMLVAFSVLSFAIQRIVVITIGFILMLTKVMGDTTSMDILKWMVRYSFESSNPLFYTIMWWINRIIGSFIFPIWIIGMTLLYFDLRIRKEGFDIEIQANPATTPT